MQYVERVYDQLGEGEVTYRQKQSASALLGGSCMLWPHLPALWIEYSLHYFHPVVHRNPLLFLLICIRVCGHWELEVHMAYRNIEDVKIMHKVR